jgi:hypothetical protein
MEQADPEPGLVVCLWLLLSGALPNQAGLEDELLSPRHTQTSIQGGAERNI